ncbi:Transglutaminase-like superfamily protein [uncultured archaeon]|nr:Transglutaminase-like superfamily protein [uncultured archaeon]
MAVSDGLKALALLAVGTAVGVAVHYGLTQGMVRHPTIEAVPKGAVIHKNFPPWATGRLAEEILGDDIKAAVYRGKNDPDVRLLAIDIIRSARLDGRQYADVAAAIQSWVRDNILYVSDPVRTEIFQEARYTLFVSKAGDCDDQAIAVASLLMAVGIPAKIILLSMDPNFNTRTSRFTHVFAAAEISGKEIWCETIVPNAALDYRHQHGGLMRIDMSTPALPAKKEIEATPDAMNNPCLPVPGFQGLADLCGLAWA